MPRKPPKKSKYFGEYQKEYNRIRNAQRRLEKQGYFFKLGGEWLTPTAPSKMPSIRKRDVTRLKKITPQYLREKAGHVEVTTGEVTATPIPKGSRRKNKPIPRKRKTLTSSKRPPKETDPFFDYQEDEPSYPEMEGNYDVLGSDTFSGYDELVISNIRGQLSKFPNAEGARILEGWLDEVLRTYGEVAVAKMLSGGIEAGVVITYETVYRGGFHTYASQMLSYLPKWSNSISTKEQRDRLTEIMEEMEDWSEPG